MPDINPAALSRTDSTTNLSTTSSLASKSLSISAPSASKSKPVQTVPRVDLEPLYTALKNVISDHWSTYKDALSSFILGHLNQEELSRQTDHFIAVDATREHLHNQLICAIHANTLRDVPEQPVASWVSANDKPLASGLKQASGDAAEQRLKFEAMALPPRVRHRLKNINDDATPTPLLAQITAHNAAKSVSSTAPTSSSSSSAAASSGLNKDLDIKKRFNQSLISESRDLPQPSALTDRLIPICYEEGLPSGAAQPAGCVELLATAVETYVKEALAQLFQRTRSDTPISAPLLGAMGLVGAISGTTNSGGAATCVLTAGYKRRVDKEEKMLARGEVKRNEAGLLPAEIAASASHRGSKGAVGDLKVALELGESHLGGMAPWMEERLVLGEGYDGYFQELQAESEKDAEVPDAAVVNGVVPTLVNGVSTTSILTNGVLHDDPMDVDEEAWSWQGATARDRDELSSLIDSCLAAGR